MHRGLRFLVRFEQAAVAILGTFCRANRCELSHVLASVFEHDVLCFGYAVSAIGLPPFF